MLRCHQDPEHEAKRAKVAAQRRLQRQLMTEDQKKEVRARRAARMRERRATAKMLAEMETPTQYKPDDSGQLKPSNTEAGSMFLKVEKDADSFRCDRCGHECASRGQLNSHISRQHTSGQRRRKRECGWCQYRASSSTELSDHYLTEHKSQRSFRCDLCGLTLSSAASLKMHAMTHTGEKPYACDTCGKAFTQKGYLNIHIRIHTGEKPYKCDFCDKTFAQCSARRSHMRIHTGEKPYKCDFCDTMFSQWSAKRTHMLAHAGEKSYRRAVSDETFSIPGSLKTHVLAHTDEEHHALAVGGASSGQKRLETVSGRPSSDKSAVVCGVCNKAFTTKNGLKSHSRAHTGEKPFICVMCGASFRWTSNLRTHYLFHAGNKRYRCHLCDKAYVQRCDLRTHVRNHSKFPCDKCSKTFCSQRSLNEHAGCHAGTLPFRSDASCEAFASGGPSRHVERNADGMLVESDIHQKSRAYKSDPVNVPQDIWDKLETESVPNQEAVKTEWAQGGVTVKTEPVAELVGIRS